MRERGRERPSQVWDIPLEVGVSFISSAGMGGGVPPGGLLVWLRGGIWDKGDGRDIQRKDTGIKV